MTAVIKNINGKKLVLDPEKSMRRPGLKNVATFSENGKTIVCGYMFGSKSERKKIGAPWTSENATGQMISDIDQAFAVMQDAPHNTWDLVYLVHVDSEFISGLIHKNKYKKINGKWKFDRIKRTIVNVQDLRRAVVQKEFWMKNGVIMNWRESQKQTAL